MMFCRWSLIAGRVPGRTDNQVKNHWNTHLRKKLGIKKQVSSSTTQPEQTQKTPLHNINYEHTQNSKFVENQDSAETSNWEPEIVNQQCYKESLLFPTDFYLNLYSPGLMEFLDENPPDQIFQNN